MKIAILGGGFTGLTAAYYLAKKGHKVTLFEKEKVLGGLASGFKGEGWDWSLERAYHHLFSNDDDILNFAKEVGFKKIFFSEPETASLYKIKNNYRTFPVDTPQDFLKFPLLSLPDKLRSGLVLAFLKFSPFFSFYEQQTAKEFLTKTMGDHVWEVLWQELFRKKFGKYAERILTSFIWARIKKRTKSLGYIEGGFQTFINYLEEKNGSLGVIIKKGIGIDQIIQNPEFRVQNEKFDAIISTLPTPVLIKIGEGIFPENYLSRSKKIKYMHAVTFILETEKPMLSQTYWLNIVDEKLPLMILAQHTNFIDKKHYNNHHLLYVSWYVNADDSLLKMTSEEILNFISPYLKKINSQFSTLNSKFYLFKGAFAQPIFDREFLKNKPDFITPVKNFYIANLDMTYPYDRGTNFAVRLGKQVAEMI